MKAKSKAGKKSDGDAARLSRVISSRREDAESARGEPALSRLRWRALVLLALAELLGMSLWFSASAVVPALTSEWHLSASGASWLTLAVQLGFVAGTLLSALFNLPDIISPRRLFTVAAIGGAVVNAAFGLFAHDATTGIALRFLVGLCLAGVYPPGMKIMATWFRHGRGMALGVLVGALTLGKASPYLVNALGSANWRLNVLFVSMLAVAGGLIVQLFVEDGPDALPAAKFDLRQIARVFSNRGVRLANFGYFGHMWELYAMWTWTPVMIRASLAARGESSTLAEAASFLVIGAGAVGCVAAGLVADRVGRTAVTSWAMTLSGACCVAVGFLFDSSPWLLLALAAVWGASVVADSAQFSTCVTELGDPQYMGTALTIQTCCGFLLTTLSIQLIPILVGWVGWRYAFIALAPGPVFGVLAMLKLRSLPEALKIAHGRR
ncbi:MAG: MFS transporter [Acidobacteria bacterium]|nr:MFS transporter [Acidobacteriota bacterium]